MSATRRDQDARRDPAGRHSLRNGPGEDHESSVRNAVEAAEIGIARVTEEAWRSFEGATPGRHAEAVLGLDGSRDPRDQITHRGCAHGRACYDAEVFAVDREGPDEVDVRIRSTGTAGAVRKTIVCVVRFGLGPSPVFDHAYFLDGFAWLRGAGLTVHGDVASNGDLECRDVRINGSLRAARNPELGSIGSITGASRCDSIDVYRSRSGGRARPTNPTAEREEGEEGIEGVSEPYVYPTGYPGVSSREEGARPIAMPRLDDLDRYVALAEDRGGTLVADGVIVTAGGGRRGPLVLVGTAESPIRIRGPVVVDGDVILRGVITGQGTIYATRNIHVVGDLRYGTAPTWPKPSSWPGVDDATNRSADALGLVARGNVVIGDTTRPGFTGSVARHARPPFTMPYPVDATGDDLGYANGRGEDGPEFDGDYTGLDGGEKSDGSPRRFHESSLSDVAFGALADGPVRQIDAVLCAGHAVLGELGQARINGAIVARDEALVFDGSLTLSYDIRLHSGAFRELDIFLPRGPRKRLLLWQESGEEVRAGQMAS